MTQQMNRPNQNRQTYQEPVAEPPAEPGPAPAPPKPRAPEPAPSHTGDTAPFRPVRRPPMAVLKIFDDGGKSGEEIRLRKSSFIIGRTEGDLVLGNDPLLSGRHAELVRVCQAGRYSWLLRDLNSTNGSFVLVRGMVLKENMEILISRNRFRFVANHGYMMPGPSAEENAVEEPPPAPTNMRQTMNWQAPTVALAPHRPFLIELLHAGEGRKFPLRDDCQFIGRDPRRCQIPLPEDETLDLCHAKIFLDAQNRWRLEDCNSQNGVWLRVPEIALGAQSSFLLGEQVFSLAIP